MIENPYNLAEIPRDLTGSSGQIQTSDVHAIAGSKKRKRSELAVGIDHQGINIYNIQSSKVVASYAISPQTTFNCPPCSIRSRRRGVETPRRYTYCSVKSPKPKLVCYSESSGHKTLGDGVETISLDLDPKAKPVIYVDTYQVSIGGTSDGNPDHKLLAVHKDGTVSCFPKDLGFREWTTHSIHNASSEDSASGVLVEHAAILSVQLARKTLLKNRDDVLATLSAASEGLDSSLLLVIARSSVKDNAGGKSDLMLRVFGIKAAILEANAPFGSSRQRLHELTSSVLPEPSHLSQHSKFTFYPLFGSLHQNTEGSFTVYNLNGSTPRLVHEIHLADTTSSCMQLSPSLLAYSSGTSLSIIDLSYYSLQAERDMSEAIKALGWAQSSKNNRGQPIYLRLLSYFAPLDVIVALGGRKLVAIQLSTDSLQSGGSRKRKGGGYLVNSIAHRSTLATGTAVGRSASDGKAQSLGSYLPSSVMGQQWSDQKASLDRSASQSDTRKFEEAAARALGLESEKGDDSELYSVSASAIDRRKVYHILGNIFAVGKGQEPGGEAQTEDPSTLKMRFLPRRMCHWLIKEGLFTTYHVEMSLKHQGALSFTSELTTGALINAIAALDTSLELISSILDSHVPFSSGELVHVLVIIARGTESLEMTEGGRLLTNGDLADNFDNIDGNKMQLTNGQASDSSHPPLSTSPDDEVRHRILSLTQKRLYACPASSIARALKRELSTAQLRLLVDALRMEIARSGWLSPYDDSLKSTGVQDNYQLCYIAHLFNCVIDSIGTGGWILETSMTEELSKTANTIAYMKAEISAALEGIEEATYLKGMLGEMLLCGKDAPKSAPKLLRPDHGQRTAVLVGPMTIALNEGDSRLLPLGLKIAPAISTTRVGAGSELVKRSKRDIGRLKSKMVGKYSFDRIVI